MNYYPHHLGDYAAATSHLSWDEDMAYTRLLRAYYTAEKGIPDATKYRVARAATAKQRQAVNVVLQEFFTLREGVWAQRRADEEIAAYQDKQEKAKRSAEARWNGKRPQSERNANALQGEAIRSASFIQPAHAVAAQHEKSSERTAQGQVTSDQLLTEQSPHANAMRTHSEGNAPITNNQKEQEPASPLAQSEKPARDPEPTPTPTERAAPSVELTVSAAAKACLFMRQAGAGRVNPSHPILLAGLAEGATPAMYGQAMREAIDRGKGEPFAYAIATVRAQLAEAKRPPQEPRHAERSPSRKRSVVERVEANIIERREREAAAAEPGASPLATLAR